MIKALLTRGADTTVMVAVAPAHVFRSAHLAYFTNTQSAKAPVVPLGVVVEINVLHLRGYGLLARQQLSNSDLECMGLFARRRLEKPFEYFIENVKQLFKNMETDVSLRGQLIDKIGSGYSSIATLNVQNHLIKEEWAMGAGADIMFPVSAALKQKATEEFEKFWLSVQTNKAKNPQDMQEEYQWAQAA